MPHPGVVYQAHDVPADQEDGDVLRGVDAVDGVEEEGDDGEMVGQEVVLEGLPRLDAVALVGGKEFVHDVDGEDLEDYEEEDHPDRELDADDAVDDGTQGEEVLVDQGCHEDIEVRGDFVEASETLLAGR